jgi:hypothetical protein
VANSTDEAWSFAGVSLHQHGWSVATLGGGRLGVPPLRGDNQTAAYVPGELWVPKIPDARTITLRMWVIGADPATGAAVGDPRLRWNDSWAYLRQVFWNPDAESPLVRRWWRTDPVTGQPGIAWAEAYAQLDTGSDISMAMTGRTRAEFEVPLRLAHPFFYGPTVTTTLGAGASANTVSIVNNGDWTAWSKYFYIDLVGPLVAPRITNTSPATDVYCGLPGKVAAGETVTLDVRQFVAMSAKTGTATKTNRSGEIYNSGAAPWMALQRGTNSLTLTVTGSYAANTGHAVVRFRPPYL